MPLSGLVLRLTKGSPLTATEGDGNWSKIRDFCNALEQLMLVVLKPNGTLKDGAVGSSSVLADGVVTASKLASDAKLPSGMMVPFGGGSVPTGWYLCDGSQKLRTGTVDSGGDQDLFAAIADAWGAGDGSTTFNLPDLRGYTVVGSGAALAGLTNRSVGAKFGEETHTLTVDETPAHNHAASGVSGTFATLKNGTGDQDNTALRTVSDSAVATNGWLGSHNTDSVGGGNPHNNMQPSAYVNWIIKR